MTSDTGYSDPSQPAARAPQKKKGLILAVALLFGALAVGLMLAVLARKPVPTDDKPKMPTVATLVAKKNLKRGDVISKETVAVRPVPREWAQSNGMVPADFEKYEGRPLAYALKSGDVLFPALLQGGGETFSNRVEPGRRAITMSVDEISSISGLVEPGDVIDLLLTPRTDMQESSAPILVLQGVQVMATGQRTENDPRTGETRRFNTVTLNTTPEQARNIVNARELGKLTALLRNPTDKTVQGAQEVDVSGMHRTRRVAPPVERTVAKPSAPVRSNDVQILYGGSSGGSHRVTNSTLPAAQSRDSAPKSAESAE